MGKGGKGANTKASVAKEPQSLELKIEQGGYCLDFEYGFIQYRMVMNYSLLLLFISWNVGFALLCMATGCFLFSVLRLYLFFFFTFILLLMELREVCLLV